MPGWLTAVVYISILSAGVGAFSAGFAMGRLHKDRENG